jgi:hypothetical protein
MYRSNIIDIPINKNTITNNALGPFLRKIHKRKGKIAYSCTIIEKNHHGPLIVSASLGTNPNNKVSFSKLLFIIVKPGNICS